MWESRQTVQADTPMVAETVPEPPPAPQYVEVTVPRDAVLGLQIERTVSSENARTEDRVTARVTRDVRVGNRIAIPAGSLVTGSVLDVDRGGRVRGRSRLSIRFHTLTLTDGTDVTLRTDPVIREGQSASGESAAKVGGAAIGGAILGAILGGQRGAAVGAGIGAAGGTAAAMTNTPDAARLSAGTTITLRMQEQLIVSVPRD
jgi:type IV secretory pathway VirB10-like protein